MLASPTGLAFETKNGNGRSTEKIIKQKPPISQAQNVERSSSHKENLIKKPYATESKPKPSFPLKIPLPNNHQDANGKVKVSNRSGTDNSPVRTPFE